MGVWGASVARLGCICSGGHEELLIDLKQGGSVPKPVSWKDCRLKDERAGVTSEGPGAGVQGGGGKGVQRKAAVEM